MHTSLKSLKGFTNLHNIFTQACLVPSQVYIYNTNIYLNLKTSNTNHASYYLCDHYSNTTKWFPRYRVLLRENKHYAKVHISIHFTHRGGSITHDGLFQLLENMHKHTTWSSIYTNVRLIYSAKSCPRKTGRHNTRSLNVLANFK